MNRGIFVNPSLDKKNYLSLLKIFHPDVSDLGVEIATRITQVINSAKDGGATVTNPFKSQNKTQSYQSYSQAKKSPKPETDFDNWWKNWSNYSDKSKSNNQKRQQKSNQQKPPSAKPDFETWLGSVPLTYWRKFGDKSTFERDYSVPFRIFKPCYYAYFNTELEIVFRKGYICREKVTKIHRNIFLIINQVDLSELNKNDLWKICELEGISSTKSARKDDLVEEILIHNIGLSVDSTLNQDKNERYWTLSISKNKPLWKHKFIYPRYHDNFQQFSSPKNRQSNQREPHNKSNTSNYLNCGQYLRLRNKWLESDQFLDFLRLTRKKAQKAGLELINVDGYPGYPMDILDSALAEILI